MSDQVPSPEQAYPSGTLPRVSRDIQKSLAGDVQETGLTHVLSLAEKRLSDDNPELYSMVAEYLRGTGVESREAISAAHSAMVLTYELLRRQAETDSLAAQLES